MENSNTCNKKAIVLCSLAFDNLSLFLAQAKAMAYLATDADFENFASNTLSDYWGAVIEILEQASVALQKLLPK